MHPGFADKSYAKTTLVCVVVVAVAILFALVGPYWLPGNVGRVGTVLSALVALGGTMLAFAGAVVLIRCQRSALGKPDLFLAMNRSREAAAIKAAAAAHTTSVRRWLARSLLGHDLIVGDLVEIKPWGEIRATLDERGCLDELPFMPEMIAMCGQRAYVFRCMHRIFDYRKTRRMRHMDGAVLLVEATCDGRSHGGCEAACHTVWKAAWLRRIESGESIKCVSLEAVGTAESSGRAESRRELAVLEFGTKAPRYVCQLTELHAASQPVREWSAVNFIRPLVAGNVTLGAFVVGWLTSLFNDVQQLRGGVGYPAFEVPVRNRSNDVESRLEPGDEVVVKPSAEIRATLDDHLMHRGLWLEPDMLKHCGHRNIVQREVTKIIDIVTGELRTMKTPAYILRHIRFSGERQLFNSQHEPLFWRGAWLRRDRS